MALLRIKTKWFKKEGREHGAYETATVIASTLWRLADKAVINLSKADYDIITPQRGFTIMAELMAFMIHLTDRLIYEQEVDDADREALIKALSKRLAEIIEDNVYSVIGNNGYDYQTDILARFNRRATDYATFDFPAEKPSFAVLRYLGNCILEIMEERDQPWVIDQIMELEAPAMIDHVKKTVQGLMEQFTPNEE
jgi:hypothetical protein